MLKELLQKNRSYRRFYQKPILSNADLRDLIQAARLSPSARNDQPVKFILIQSKEACAAIFPYCMWAGYLKDWDGPAEHERPTSYIIVLDDTRIAESIDTDIGIMCQSILLTAVEKGFGGCLLGSVNRKAIREIFSIDGHYAIAYVIALGKPSEIVVIENIKDNDTHYYRDMQNVHHVPKRGIDELIIETR